MTTTGDDKKIKTAIGFLNNPKVIPAPEDKKREFLKKKGSLLYSYLQYLRFDR